MKLQISSHEDTEPAVRGAAVTKHREYKHISGKVLEYWVFLGFLQTQVRITSLSVIIVGGQLKIEFLIL